MAKPKFTILSERPIGILNEFHWNKWRALQERQKNLKATEQQLSDAVQRFTELLADSMELKTAGVVGMRFDDEGHGYQQICSCPSCQATVQGLTLEVTLIEMKSAGLIDEAQIKKILTSKVHKLLKN